MSKHNKGKTRHKPNKVKDKQGTTQVTLIQKNEEPQVKLVDNQTGKLVPTKEDKAKVNAAKEAQRLYRAKRLEAQEALRKAKQAFEALNGSEAIKSLKTELEDKIKDAEAKVIKAREEFKAKVESYNSLLVEYKELTGITKKAVKANAKGKRTGNRITGNGDWTPAVKEDKDKTIKVIVKHNPTKKVFEYSLLAEDGNGMIPYSSWINLRKAFYQKDGTDGPKSVFYDLYQSLGKEDKDNFRAFLYPRLYTLISNVKAIADKV